MQYHEAGLDLDEKTPEVAALKQELSRMMIGTHPEFSRLVDAYMTLDDLFAIRDRLIGSGRIGGKAAGMLLARRILVTEPGETDFAEALEAHDSFYIGSDVFFTFLVNNDLFRMRLQLSRAANISREEFAEVEKRFLAGRFPPRSWSSSGTCSPTSARRRSSPVRAACSRTASGTPSPGSTTANTARTRGRRRSGSRRSSAP